MPRIVFCYPSRIIGGAELLFLRLYRYLKEQGVNVRLVEYRNSGVYRRLGISEEHLVEVESIFRLGNIDCDTFVTTPNLSFDGLYGLNLPAAAKLVFWSLHPLNCLPILPFGFYKRAPTESLMRRLIDVSVLAAQYSFARRLFSLADQREGLYFMDAENWRMAERGLRMRLVDRFIPIPVDEVAPAPLKRDRPRVDAPISIFWVGRLVDFKIGALVRLIQDLEQRAKQSSRRIVLHVVGSGAEVPCDAEMLSVRFRGDLPPAELKRVLASECDVLFAMGTSALEGAALGIATVLVMPTYQPIGRPRQYLPLFNTKDFDLGSFECNTNDLLSFDELLGSHELLSRDFAERCHAYVAKHHSMPASAAGLLAAAELSRLRYADLGDFVGRRFPSRLLYGSLQGR